MKERISAYEAAFKFVGQFKTLNLIDFGIKLLEHHYGNWTT